MLLKSWTFTIPFVLLYIYRFDAVYSQENHKRRHEGHHHHKHHIPEARWDIWSQWSPCSVDCGSGVSKRTRICRSMVDGGFSDRCRGKSEEIKLCEITGCIKQVEDVCRELQQKAFRGQRYRWIPYKHPSKLCEVACRPVSAGFYLGLGKNMSDGTPCGNEGNQICVSGACKTLGCDKVVDSEAVVDKCGECGGDGTSCKRVHKTFTDDVKAFGYHTITTIPRGSTKIRITDEGQSRNYLAVKATDDSFHINTGFRLSRFGSHHGAGTEFIYSRGNTQDCPDECITADGPTDVSVDIMILAYTENKGIDYSFNVPADHKDFDETDEGVSPMVYIQGETEGTRVVVVDDISQEKEDREDSIEIGKSVARINRTDALQSPKSGVLTQDSDTDQVAGDMYNRDNTIPSLYSWSVSGYTKCSATCGTGKQTQIFECIVTDKKVKVDERYCSGLIKPSTSVMECNYGACPSSWKAKSWSKCSVTCGTGVQSRDYRCVTPNGVEVRSYECGSAIPQREERTCDMGSCTSGWYFTEWPKDCPAACGYGTLNRQVHCISDTGNARTACPEREKPAASKTCRSDDCGAYWLTGPWSECNATCGMAYQKRAVICASRQSRRVSIVSESACVEEEKPSTYMSCDLDPCQPEWYMNEWGKCSVTCGSGFRARGVHCLDENKQSSSGCDPKKKPVLKEQCKERRCPLSDESKPAEPTKTTSEQPKPTTERPPRRRPGQRKCVDKFQQCDMVLRASLCQYKYYQKICCHSCKLVNENT